jgi:hypothetical protein
VKRVIVTTADDFMIAAISRRRMRALSRGCGMARGLPEVVGMGGRRRVGALVAALLALGGCATSTRTAKMGPLSTGPLVTLIVSDDRAVVERECREVPALGPVLGCSIWHTVQPDGKTDVKMMKVVRYTDALPSALALEIDAHELCHVVAALQPIDDPCHVGNGGIVRAGAPNARGMTR